MTCNPFRASQRGCSLRSTDNLLYFVRICTPQGNGVVVGRKERQRAAQRERDLVRLDEWLSRSLPPVSGSAQSYVVVVEDRPGFLTEGLSSAKELIAGRPYGGSVVAVVGVEARDVPEECVLWSGPGTDIRKMAQVADWIAAGHLPGPVTLLVPPHRAWLLNGHLQQLLDLRGVLLGTEAMDVAYTAPVNREGAIEQARQLIQAVEAGDISPIWELSPGAEMRQVYERLTT